MFGDLDPYYGIATGAAILALVVSLAVLRDAYIDHRTVRRLGIGNGRARIARDELLTELARTGVIISVGASVTAAAVLAGPIGDVTLLGLVPRVGIIVAFVIITLDAIGNLRYRAWLRSAYGPGVDGPDSLHLDEEDADGL